MEHATDSVSDSPAASVQLPEPDPELLPLATYAVYQVKQGEMLSVMLHLGERLGLFEAMADGFALTSSEVASAAGVEERWAREWLYAVSAGGMVTHERDGDSERFGLAPEWLSVKTR